MKAWRCPKTGMMSPGGEGMRIRAAALSLGLANCAGPTALVPVAAEHEVRRSPLQEAVEASSHWSDLQTAAPSCPQIAPLVERIRDGEYSRAWYEQRWPVDEPTPACALAYDAAWNILWPVSSFLRKLAEPAGDMNGISRTYPWLKDPILEMTPRPSLDQHLEAVRRRCAYELSSPSFYRHPREASCSGRVATFESIAKGTAFAGRAERLYDDLVACHVRLERDKCK